MRSLGLIGLPGLFLAAAPLHALELQLGVRDDGVHRVRYEQLAAAGLGGPVASERLALSHRGEAVRAWIDDGGDGVFGPGDSLDFVGSHLPGEHGYYSEHSPWNVYRLSIAGQARPGVDSGETVSDTESRVPARVRMRWRRELNRIRVRFNAYFVPEHPEIWYWQRLSVLDEAPFELELPREIVEAEGDEVRLRIGLRGWSTPQDSDGLAGHRVEVLDRGRLIGTGEWDGQAEHVIEIDGLHRSGGEPALSLRVPRRPLPDGRGDIVDVSLLNWIEVDYPFSAPHSAGQSRLDVRAAGVLPLEGEGWALYGGTQRVVPDGGPVTVAPGEWWLVRSGAYRAPAWIREDRPSALRRTARQADYLMITHGSLLEAARPLAELHRRRGLTVELVDVQDVFDEFNHGIVHPRAIRDFVAYADRHWRKPAPRYVLLVGDASWDPFNDLPEDRLYADWTFQARERARFVKNRSTPYLDQRRRNLVPAWSVATYEGYAAADNGFVAVRGDDIKPDLAIGRLPVATPEELAAVVAKIETYALRSEPGPWRRSTLWITNEQQMYQQATEEMLALPVLDGFQTQRVYPSPGGADNAVHQAQILEAFDAGNALVHFVGHGGRYIWRTGPPDPRKNHDLFTLDHLDQLAPTRQLPVVLSMTCYSAPFDHPTADSIGEKFLRLPGRGAIAVIAASWRNFPAPMFSRALITELLSEGTIGEALMRAKQRMNDPLLVETYNLLGDPALPLSVPRGRMHLQRTVHGVAGRLPDAPGAGSVLLDFIDAAGRVLEQREASFQDGRFEVGIPTRLAGDVQAVRAYAWNAGAGYDAVGEIILGR